MDCLFKCSARRQQLHTVIQYATGTFREIKSAGDLLNPRIESGIFCWEAKMVARHALDVATHEDTVSENGQCGQ